MRTSAIGGSQKFRGFRAPEAERGLDSRLLGPEVELARDLDAALDGSSDRTRVSVDVYHPLYLLAVFLLGGEVEGLLDSLNDEYLLLGLYLPYRVGVEAVEGNLTRYQRAPKGAKQSAARRSDEVIQRRSVRVLHVGGDPVVLGDLAVDAEHHRLLYGGEVCTPDLALDGLHSYA